MIDFGDLLANPERVTGGGPDGDAVALNFGDRGVRLH
jgi:hypothetical protein